MQSNTHTPLYQLVEWLGINPYIFNGIDIDGDTIPNPNGYKKDRDVCDCFLQKSYTSPTQITREEIESYLSRAEQIFFNLTKIHLSPVQIYEEKHGYRLTHFRNGCYFVKPQYLCELRNYGTITKTFITNASVDKSSKPFTLTFPVPDGTQPEEIRVYFNQSDYDYVVDYNDHYYEIRPINVKITSNIATIKIPPYLLKNPDLNESEECLEDTDDIYVSTLDVFRFTNNKCKQGSIVCNASCNGCDMEKHNACATEKYNLGTDRVCMMPYDCETGQNTICNCSFNGVEINYQTGYKLQKNKYIDAHIFNNIIAPLTLGLMYDNFKNFCRCDDRVYKRIDMYSKPPYFVSQMSKGYAQDESLEKTLLINSKTINRMGGLMPTLGITTAMKLIDEIDCYKVAGGNI